MLSQHVFVKIQRLFLFQFFALLVRYFQDSHLCNLKPSRQPGVQPGRGALLPAYRPSKRKGPTERQALSLIRCTPTLPRQPKPRALRVGGGVGDGLAKSERTQ